MNLLGKVSRLSKNRKAGNFPAFLFDFLATLAYLLDDQHRIVPGFVLFKA